MKEPISYKIPLCVVFLSLLNGYSRVNRHWIYCIHIFSEYECLISFSFSNTMGVQLSSSWKKKIMETKF